MELIKNNKVISKASTDLVFTRYLYIKEEVRISLLISILNKSEDAIFWAFELYYSGFKNELFNLIWKIYYDFFYSLNPAYESYLLKKQKDLFKDNNNKIQDIIISSIIQDLLFRPFNTDIFMLRNICENFEVEIIYNECEIISNIEEVRINFIKWIANNDFRSIAQWILNINNSIDVIDIYNICLDIFEQDTKLPKSKYKKELLNVLNLNINKNIILLAKIIQLFTKKAQLKKGKSIYINVEPEDIVQFESIVGSQNIKNYNILKKAYMCAIDDLKHLSLFKLTRNKFDIQDAYKYNWEYYASFSPLWEKRIKQFGGFIDYDKKKVIFKEDPDDDLMQEFYELYGLEPDEQNSQVQNKSIQKIEKIHNWKWFQKQYKNNNLFEVYEEELEEFDVDGLNY